MEKFYEDMLNALPESIDFNFIPAKNESYRIITLENKSNVSMIFRIEHSNTETSSTQQQQHTTTTNIQQHKSNMNFIFEPSNGLIHKQHKQEIKIKITPSSAKVLVANCRVVIDDKASKILKLSCISKFPYLTINKTALDFGSIQIGKHTVQELIISNPENVAAKFTITKHSEQPGKHPEVFLLSTYTGEVPPNSAFLVKIKYQTFFPNVNSYETFTLRTQGGNTLRFSCTGSCFPLSVWLSNKYVSFKSIPLGNQMTKLIRVYNGSEQETEYQIFHNNDGAFRIYNTEGVIKPHSNVRVTIMFKPYETTTYYERVFCLVKNHILISLDVYGACHDLLTKSLIIEQRFIDMFRYKILNGLYFPNSNNGDNNSSGSKNEFIEKITRSLASNKNGLDIPMESTNQLQLHKELFWETTANTRIVSFDTEHIDFRFVENGRSSEAYVLRVRNNTTERVRVKWVLEKPINTSNLVSNNNLFNYNECVFVIQPEECTINKLQTADFKVYFKPNKSEYYFYADITCQATLLAVTSSLTGDNDVNNNNNTKSKLRSTAYGGGLGVNVNKKLLKPITNNANTNVQPNKHQKQFANKTISSFGFKTRMNSTLYNTTTNEYFDPPTSSKLSVVGHSFPPGNQIFIPMYELNPSKEIFFPPSTLHQSMYQTLKILNKSDTPLFYKISSDPTNVFRVHRKYGLIPSNSFHLICIEFSPKDTTVYRYPLRIILNHDNLNMKTIILNGLSVDPVIELEGIKNEIYFPPTFVGIKSTKKIVVINRSPIKVNVNIKVDQTKSGVIDVKPSAFEMETNLIKEIEIAFTPTKVEEITTKLCFYVDRIYDASSEMIGIYNPGSSALVKVNNNNDKRTFVREVNVLGRGSDGKITIDPPQLEFGTVKVGFHKKLTFSISNPTITNFYIKLLIDAVEDEKHQKDSIIFDFTEGLINSYCKKEVGVTFKPSTRSAVNLRVMIYATESSSSSSSDSNNANERSNEFTPERSLKCELFIKANGDYPLIKIADIRNDSVGTCALWHSFNVDEANTELQKQLTDEEINYLSSDKDNNHKKVQEFTNKLKCITFNFGKHIKKKTHRIGMNDYFDVYLTLKNEGGVTSEFYFKFSDDIAIKREIWMDPVEPTSNDKVEYHVLKEKIFEIEPRKSKLEPNECCNIRLRYNKKEKGDHRLRVIFQIVNGKPLIFELFAQCYSDKQGILEIKRPVLDFSYVPIGYMNYLVSPLELSNVGGVKIKYKIESKEIDKFNNDNDHFEIFKIDSIEGSIGPGDVMHLPVFFRPLTSKLYTMNLLVHYTDEQTGPSNIPIVIKGHGYHPHQFVPPPMLSPFHTMPQDRMCNHFEGGLIQKCGVSVEELDFGEMKEKPTNKTFILYNFSDSNSFNFDIREPTFILKDDIEIKPNKDKLEKNSHILIKLTLTPKALISNYHGEIEINITWNAEKANKVLEKEKLHIRIRKRSQMKETASTDIVKENNDNMCFVEAMLEEFTREILSEQSFSELLLKNLEMQPLGIFDWTSDIAYPEQSEVRKLLMANYSNKADTIVSNELNNTTNSNKTNKKTIPTKNAPSHNMSNASGNKVQQQNEPDLYGENADLNIQEKYMKELLCKYKMTVPEVNEALALVNEESRKLLSNDIMEATIYNIISEAVYGETDLTEKTRIYFFNK